MSRFSELPYPVDPEPGVPLDQTMAPVSFDGRGPDGKRPGEVSILPLRTLPRRLLKRRSKR
jgi:hypothetical protein